MKTFLFICTGNICRKRKEIILSFGTMKTKKITGLSSEILSQSFWSMTENEQPCSGREFESVCEELEKISDEEKRKKHLKPLNLYVLGDFYKERTQCIMVSSINYLSIDLIQKVQQLLKSPIAVNWRVVISIQNVASVAIIYGDALFFDGKKFKSASDLLAHIVTATN